MQLRQEQGLWLWAGTLSLLLIATLPLAVEWQLTIAVVVTGGVWAAWRRSRRIAGGEGHELQWSKGTSLPAGSYRHPVVLVVGDCLAELFGPLPAEQWALRVTGEGCYVRVPDAQKLPTTIASLLLQRPEWNEQLSVMWVVDPSVHTDVAVLANELRNVHRQIVRLRERGSPLSLLVVGFFQSTSQTSAWFTWASAKSSVQVHESGMCMSLAEWQGWSADPDLRAARLRDTVQLSAAAGWLKALCMSEMRVRTSRQEIAATAFALAWTPNSSERPDNNLWHRWLQERTGLSFDQGTSDDAYASLPFPDALLHLLPRSAQRNRQHRAVLVGGWLFVLATSIALVSSAWQNTLLVRQVTEDLRRYATASVSVEPDKGLQREGALAVLRQDAERLDHYYRQGEPWSLGLGLYQGEKLRPSLLAAINGHRIPTMPQSSPASPQMVRLDSLSLFSSGSAQLKADSTKVLVTALAGIKAQPRWLIVITGHTDATGSDEQNLRLSRARAAAVHDWIQHMGDIPSNCFAVQGLGASQPVASNDTEQGRSANRRVEIRLVPEAGACLSSTAASGLQPQSHSATSNT